MLKTTLAVILAVILAGCNTLNNVGATTDPNPPAVNEQPTPEQSNLGSAVLSDILLGCSLWQAVNQGDAVESGLLKSAERACLAAETIRNTGALGPQPEAVNDCFDLGYYSQQPEYVLYCGQRTQNFESLTLRAATLANDTIKKEFPGFPGATIHLTNFPSTPSENCGDITAFAACRYQIFLWPARYRNYPDAEAASVDIMFHEYGHVLQAYLKLLTGYSLNPQPFELQAECFKGWLGRENGATLAELLRAQKHAIDIGGAPHGTHGSGEKRAERLTLGYNEGLDACL